LPLRSNSNDDEDDDEMMTIRLHRHSSPVIPYTGFLPMQEPGPIEPIFGRVGSFRPPRPHLVQ
jgi:hypothetical protein